MKHRLAYWPKWGTSMVGDHPRMVDEQNPRETNVGWVQYPTLRGCLHYQLLNRNLSIKSIVIIHQIPLGDPLTSLVFTQIFSIKSSSLIQRSSISAYKTKSRNAIWVQPDRPIFIHNLRWRTRIDGHMFQPAPVSNLVIFASKSM